jgi:hypothetical protein
MALDLSKAKAKLQEESARMSKTKFQTIDWWKPQQGKNLVRLMPPWSADDTNPNANQFWREVYMHFKVGPNGWSGSCPTSTPYGPGGECPICEEVERLRSTGNPADSELAKDIRAKQRLYSNIVDMSDPVYTDEDVATWAAEEYNQGKECPFAAGQTKVKVFSYGPQIFKQILDIVTESVDVTDLNAGYDLMISRTGKGRDTSYNVQIMPPAKPFVPAGVNQIEDVLIDLDNILPFQELANMQAALTGAPVAAAPAVGAGSQATAALPPAPAAAPPPAAAAPPVAEPVQEVEEEEEPPCFGDKEVHDPSDAECIGGTKDIEGEMITFEPCPFFHACAEKCNPKPKPARRGRRKAVKKPPADAAVSDDIDDLEREMAEIVG